MTLIENLNEICRTLESAMSNRTDQETIPKTVTEINDENIPRSTLLIKSRI